MRKAKLCWRKRGSRRAKYREFRKVGYDGESTKEKADSR
jgi:hypothetical protein